MKAQIQEFIFTYFEDKGGIPGKTEEEKLACNYISSGLIDSLGLMFMILAIEEKFSIKYSPENMQDPSFRTIQGLIAETVKIIDSSK